MNVELFSKLLKKRNCKKFKRFIVFCVAKLAILAAVTVDVLRKLNVIIRGTWQVRNANGFLVYVGVDVEVEIELHIDPVRNLVESIRFSVASI